MNETTHTSRGLEDVLDGLTDAQREAVTTTEGPVLVLAAAGSGKTRVITRRIAHLLSMGVPAWSILSLTFTNKAAGEMRERVHGLLEGHADADRLTRGLTIATFHSLCARLLRRYAPIMHERGAPRWGITGEYTIYDTADQRALMKRVIPALDLSTENWPTRSMLSTISSLKNEMIDARKFGAQATGFREKTVARIYEGYEKALREANAVDFDDLLLLTARILNECDEARAEINARWQYLMIDEYQDTNLVQFKLSTMLVGVAERSGSSIDDIPVMPGADEEEEKTVVDGAPNICVVGDPDQSIYGWRGADISNILEFEDVYPGARVIPLGQNFRSTAPILDTADTLIRNNALRKHKDLFTTREGGEPVDVVLCRDEHHEAQLVVDWCRLLGEEGEGNPLDVPLEWREMAVLYRNNALSRVLEDAFRKAGVPYVIARGTAFYQREEVKDALAYLRVVANPTDDVSLLRILNKPSRKIGKSSIAALEMRAARTGTSVMEAMRRAIDAGGTDGVSTIALKTMTRFVQMIDSWTGDGTYMGEQMTGSLSDLAGRVLKESGLETHYASVDAKSGSDTDESKLENLQEIVNSAIEYEKSYDPANDPDRAVFGEAGDVTISDETPPLLAMLRAYLESVSLVADSDAIDEASGAVTLMTLHAAKGLEFPAVAMVGLEEGTLPSMRAMESEKEVEEERRLCFVGITRAMERLLMTSARYRTHRGMRDRQVPSRFLGELPERSVRVSDQSDSIDDFSDPSSTPESHGSWGGPPSDDPIREGVAVRHPRFGRGTVTNVQMRGANARATVKFDQVGTKTLVLQYANLEVLG